MSRIDLSFSLYPFNTYPSSLYYFSYSFLLPVLNPCNDYPAANYFSLILFSSHILPSTISSAPPSPISIPLSILPHHSFSPITFYIRLTNHCLIPLHLHKLFLSRLIHTFWGDLLHTLLSFSLHPLPLTLSLFTISPFSCF